MSNFKIAILAIFSVSIVVGIIAFAMYKAGAGQTTYNVTYIQKNQTDFDTDFVQALADGVGPDVVILRDDSLYKNRNRFLVIPYTSYSQRTFKDTFTQETEMFLSPSGVTALPLFVDPLVLYWNRDIFANALVASPPKYW